MVSAGRFWRTKLESASSHRLHALQVADIDAQCAFDLSAIVLCRLFNVVIPRSFEPLERQLKKLGRTVTREDPNEKPTYIERIMLST